jgi:deazaflavin-dependent oxidoreductase (nitroreductase family)
MEDFRAGPQQPVTHRPSRTLKVIFDMPAAIFGRGWGWVFGKRMLAVTHTGRVSGAEYTTILEVVGFDENTQESVVVSAYGTEADWYRNIGAAPASRVKTGRLDYVPQLQFLTHAEGSEAATRFCREHPLEARLVPRVLPAIGAAIPADKADMPPEEILASLPMVAFRPKT